MAVEVETDKAMSRFSWSASFKYGLVLRRVRFGMKGV
jgi:hypothetical protein